MSEQTRVSKSKSEKKRVEELEKAESAKNEEAEKLKAETDDLLDEIDGLLEENAAEFVSAYIQKGGE
jgi:ubiquitin-like protein Pup